MLRYFSCAFYMCFWSFGLIAQQPDLNGVLQEIENNNRELQAIKASNASKTLSLRSHNNLPDPQFGAYYLPFGDNNTGDYLEMELSQSMEFPGVYKARSSLIDLQSAEFNLEYKTRRKEVLEAAKQHCLELIYLSKKRSVEEERLSAARKVLEHVETLHEMGEVGILDVQKAKVSWMQEQLKIPQLEGRERKIRQALQELNGGNTLAFERGDYPIRTELENKDTIWQEKMRSDPALLRLWQGEAVAEQQVNLARKSTLPNLVVGLSYQGVSDASYAGLLGGLSIPLWNNKYKVEAAQSALGTRRLETSSRLLEARSNFEKQFSEYQLKLSIYEEYRQTLSTLNSEEFLLQAYKLGEISFLAYYMELQFYRQAYDVMIDLELRLHLLQTSLLNHRL